MPWAEIRESYAELLKDRDAAASMAARWKAFKETVEATRDRPPYHLRTLLSTLRRIERNRPAEEIIILDHGCGGGLPLLYLLALGYRGIHGANIRGKCEEWNRLLKEEIGIIGRRFFVYDGHRMPLEDESVDLVFSQQVLEHVADDLIDSYYAEEGRVLKPGGIALHQVPHRLVPYDSHTRTWFIHYLPWSLQRLLYSLLGRNVERIECRIHLRWPSCHRREVQKHIGGYEDITLDRLMELEVGDYYDGPLAVRRMITAIVSTPVVGRLAGAVLKNFVMFETLAVRSSR